jgi:hypothetical protein
MTSKQTTIIGVSGKMGHGKDSFCERFMSVGKQMGVHIVRRAFADALKDECAEFMSQLFTYGMHIIDLGDTVESYAAIYNKLGSLLPTEWGLYPGCGLDSETHICDTEGSELLVDWYMNDLSEYVRLHGPKPLLNAYLTRDTPSCNDWIATFNKPSTKPFFRKLMQWYGTEYRRNIFGQDYWTNRMDDFLNNQEPGTIVIAPDTRFVNEMAFIKARNGFAIRVWRPGLEAEASDHISETALDDSKEFNLVVENRSTLVQLTISAHQAFVLFDQWQKGPVAKKVNKANISLGLGTLDY